MNVAQNLFEPYHAPMSVPHACLNALYLPDSRVIPADEVRRYFAEDRIAAGAFAAAGRRSFQPGRELEDWLEAQKEVGLEFPGVVDDWIADDNVGTHRTVARFRFTSAADAQQAHGELAPLAVVGLTLALAGDHLTVTLATPSLAMLAIRSAQRFGGEYVRQRCALPLR